MSAQALEISMVMFKNDPFTIPVSKEVHTIQSVTATVCEYFKQSVEMVRSPVRKRCLVRPRQFAQFFAKKLTPNTLKEIGEYFGDRDHTSVMHSRQTIKDLISEKANEVEIIAHAALCRKFCLDPYDDMFCKVVPIKTETQKEKENKIDFDKLMNFAKSVPERKAEMRFVTPPSFTRPAATYSNTSAMGNKYS